MPNPATITSLQAFEREHVNTVIHLPDYKLRRQLSLQEKEPLAVEAFSAFDEMFYLHLRWTEEGNSPDMLLSLFPTQQHTLVMELTAQSPFFTYSVGDTTYSTNPQQWSTCTWNTLATPFEVRSPMTMIPMHVDRLPTHHNDINISLEQTLTLTVTGTLWKLDDSPADSLRCQSYGAKVQQGTTCPADAASGLTPRMLANIAAMRGLAAQVDLGSALVPGAGGGEVVHIRLADEENMSMQPFTVHAFVLQAHSPVFRRMLEGQMAEATERVVTISGVSTRELEDLITSLYNLAVPLEAIEEPERLIALLSLADRYEVLPLRDECAALLAQVLSETNMAAVLKVADMHQAAGLRAAALHFITARTSRIAAVMDTDDAELRKCIRDHLLVAAKALLPSATACSSSSGQHPQQLQHRAAAMSSTAVSTIRPLDGSPSVVPLGL